MTTEELAPVGAQTETQTIETPAVETQVETGETKEPATETPTLTEEQKAEQDVRAASEAAKTLADHKEAKAKKSRERWNDMVQKKTIAEQRAERAEQRFAALEATLKAPDPSLYDDNAKYTADVVKHAVKENEVERFQNEAKTSRQEAIELSNREWAERVEDAKSEIPDLMQTIYNPQLDNMWTPAMVEAIRSAPDGVKIAYELAKNPAEVSRFNRLSPVQQAMEIGRISANLSAPVQRKITQAPEPIKTVGGRGSPPSVDPEKMNFTQFKAFREKGGK